jgi:splicing factor 3B subunit 3
MFSILSADKLDSVFNQTIIPLKYTPRRQVFDDKSKNFIIIEADNNTFSPSERKKRLVADDPNGELPVEQFGLPVAGLGNWASCLRIISPLNGETIEFMELEDNEAAFRYFILQLIHLVLPCVNLRITLEKDSSYSGLPKACK